MALFRHAILVDDDPVALFLHQHWLDKYQLAENVVHCTNTKQALSAIRQLKIGELPDLLLVDVHMPVMDGLELVETIFSSQAMLGDKAFLYLLTSSDSPKDTQRASRFPQCGYLIKPLGEEQIQHIIRKLQESGQSWA